MISYRKKYLQIYIWQAISVLLGFASLFVVVPYLSSDKILYGIYSVCASLTIFFSYADLGFLSSGVKYAAEYYIKGDHRNEMRVIGFTAFIMISIFMILALSIVILGIYPKLLIPELIDNSQSFYIARYLLFTLAAACPVIIGQRILGLIFTIRVEDYKYQRMMIIGSIVRILSVLYFFRNGQYKVVEFYIFYNFINLLVVIGGLYYSKNYGYKLKDFIATFHFDREIFDKVKKLSGTSLLMVLSMIVYYELDQIVISHFIGIEAVAIYGAALSVLTLVRTFCSLVYSPYTSRYNHFVGLGDYKGLTSFVCKMIIMFAPIIIVPILTLSILAQPFVISWIGVKYQSSAIIVSMLVLSFIFNFIKDPISCYFIATERNSYLVKFNLLSPVIYWAGVLLFMNVLGLKAFAIFKFVAPGIIALAYYYQAYKDFKLKELNFVDGKNIIVTVFTSICAALLIALFMKQFMIEEHLKSALFMNIIIMGITVLLGLLIAAPFNSILRAEIAMYYEKIKVKYVK